MKRWQKVVGAIIILIVLGCAERPEEIIIRSKQTITYPQHGEFRNDDLPTNPSNDVGPVWQWGG